MAMAETANLVARLSLQDSFTAPLAKAEAGLAHASTGITRLGGAGQKAGSHFKNLITGPLGMIGLAGGLFTLGGALTNGIHKAVEFGDEVRQLSALTGLAAPTISALAAAMEHFGLSSDRAIRLTGFLEKNVGLLAARKDGLDAFYKTFGLRLTDTNGKILDANQLLLQTADYFNNKSVPATTKAAALAKLYGRSWEDLIPFLKAGRQGIIDAEDAAAKLGLTLNQTNVDDLMKFKTATRELNTAVGGLELQIGLALVPALKDLATAATSFISDHRSDIVAFFHNLVAAGRTAIGVLMSVGSALGTAWSAIPAPLREFLTKGLIADRTIKFLFGLSPVEIIGKSLFGGIASNFFARGSSPANPIFVSAIGGGVGAAGGGGSLLPALFAGGLIVAAGAAIADAVYHALGGVPVGQAGHDAAGTPIAGTPLRVGMSQGEFYRLQATIKAAADRARQTITAGDKYIRDAIGRQRPPIVHVTTNIKVGNQNTVRISSTNSTNATGYSTGSFVKS